MSLGGVIFWSIVGGIVAIYTTRRVRSWWDERQWEKDERYAAQVLAEREAHQRQHRIVGRVDEEQIQAAAQNASAMADYLLWVQSLPETESREVGS